MVKTGIELQRFLLDDHFKYSRKESYVSFRYYVGMKGKNIIPFRFMKGGDPSLFPDSGYSSVFGPFKTMKEAINFNP